MDTKYKSHSFVKLWIATTMFMLCCFATGMLAQDAVAAETNIWKSTLNGFSKAAKYYTEVLITGGKNS